MRENPMFVHVPWLGPREGGEDLGNKRDGCQQDCRNGAGCRPLPGFTFLSDLLYSKVCSNN